MPDPRDKLPEGYMGPWIATFRDGPLADHDHDRIFSVGPIWTEIVLVQLPRDPHQPMNPWANYWTIVGGDGIPAFETERVPWEGEVTYRLVDVIPMAGVDGEPVAYYSLLLSSGQPEPSPARRGIDRLLAAFPNREVEKIDAQPEKPLMAYDVDEHGVRASKPYRMWDLPAGPWVLVTFVGGDEFAIWKHTGDVYRVGPDGAVREDPILKAQGQP